MTDTTIQPGGADPSPPAPERTEAPAGPGASAPIRASDARANEFLPAYLMGLARRMANDASNYYRKKWNIGMSEWRTLMAIGANTHQIVREVAEMADLDYAAASKSLALLKAQALVDIQPTNRRGRATVVRLTPAGLALYEELRASARARQERLVACYSAQELAQLRALLGKMEQQIPFMNEENAFIKEEENAG